MKVLLVHLSDIHIRGKSDHVLSKASKISEAVRNLEHDLAACYVVVSGDTAFSGSDEQYYLALGFMEDLKEALVSHFRASVDVRFVLVPGNHDCEFSAETCNNRDELVREVVTNAEKAPDEGAVAACVRAQENYFQYMELFDDHLEMDSRLYYEYRFDLEEPKLLFRCYNTSWMSWKDEEQGKLVYPLDEIKGGGDGFDLVVSVFHHPYNWLYWKNAHAFRERVGEISDIVLTGHEHSPTHYSDTVLTGHEHDLARYTRKRNQYTNEYIEGGVLQDKSSKTSSFNALVLDVAGKQKKFFRFDWDDDMYSLNLEESSESWEDLQVNRRAFEVDEEFGRRLEDPGADLRHPSRGTLKLSDVFVWPDLREIKYKDYKDGVPHLVNGEDVFEHVLEKRKLLIVGADKSGKTPLAKMLFTEFRDRGFVPVLIDGSAFRVRPEKTPDAIYRLFEEQYSPNLLERFKQLDRAEKVLIFDAFDRLNLNNPRAREKFFDVIEDFSDHIVLLANEQAQQIRELANCGRAGDPSAALHCYELQEFGPVLREALIGKWLSLSDDYCESGGIDKLEQKYDRAHKVLDTVIGRNFIPAYPVFVLSVLQALEIGAPVDTNASTYGYFYELFIKTSLAKTSDPAEYDVKTAYLSFMAYQFYVQRLSEPSLEELRDIHQDYEREYDLPIPFERLLENLEQARILNKEGEGYRFKYDYIYYYFVASYMRDHISEEEVRGHISEMSEKIHVEEYANILLFLVHLIKDPYTIGEMLSRAGKVFGGYEPARFEDDAKFFSDGKAGGDGEVHHDGKKKLSDSWRERWERIDAEGRGIVPHVTDHTEAETGEAFELDVAMKTVQILGQTLKNFPGSLSGDLKLELAKGCYGLGLRSLRAMLDVVRESSEDSTHYLVQYMQKQHPGEATEELTERAKRTIFGFAMVMAYFIVKAFSHSVGSHLLMETYKRVLEEDPEPSTAVRLIDMSIKLDHKADFPKRECRRLGDELRSNPFGMALLRHLVVNHFYLFPVDFATRQSVCQDLGISYDKVRVINPKLKKVDGNLLYPTFRTSHQQIE